MIVYKKISNDDEPFSKLQIEINFPEIGWQNKITRNTFGWIEQDYKSFCILFNTGIYITSSKGYLFFSFNILGFGITITKQNDYD